MTSRSAARSLATIAGLALTLAACSGGDPWDRAPRFAVVPHEGAGPSEPLRVGVAWIPAAGPADLAVTDAIDVPAIEQDFGWTPTTPPPSSALRCAADCNGAPTAAVGWIVVFVDGDGDGTAAVRLPEETPWSPEFLVAPGQDVLVGMATDYAIAYAPASLPPGPGLSQTLGWPLTAGLSVMRVVRRDHADLLEPLASGERVPIYLLERSNGEGQAPDEELGLCCSSEDCDAGPVRCPTFQGQGDQVD